MPSVSIAQQKLMGMAYALKKGDMDPADASQEVKDLADGLTLKQLKDFAETKHEGLPYHVEESELNEWLPGVAAGSKWYTQPAQNAASYNYDIKDHTDSLIKSYLKFINSGKKPSKESETEIKEDATAPSSYSSVRSTPANTPGMGNAEPAGPGKLGSGDVFNNGADDEDDEDDRKQAPVLTYKKFIMTTANKSAASKANIN